MFVVLNINSKGNVASICSNALKKKSQNKGHAHRYIWIMGLMVKAVT